MPSPRDASKTERWEHLKALTVELSLVQDVATPEARAIAEAIRRDIAAVYRAAGLPYPTTPPIDSDADARIAMLATVLDELRLQADTLTAIAAMTTTMARLERARSRVAVRVAQAIRATKLERFCRNSQSQSE